MGGRVIEDQEPAAVRLEQVLQRSVSRRSEAADKSLPEVFQARRSNDIIMSLDIPHSVKAILHPVSILQANSRLAYAWRSRHNLNPGSADGTTAVCEQRLDLLKITVSTYKRTHRMRQADDCRTFLDEGEERGSHLPKERAILLLQERVSADSESVRSQTLAIPKALEGQRLGGQAE